MKKLFLVFTVLCAQVLAAQVNVSLHLHPKLGNQPFALNTTATADMGYPFQVTRLQYYLSEIKLIHDGGQVSNAAIRHLLVTAQEDSIFEMGNLPVTNIEGIAFSIGVDPAHNHLDPASYPSDDPLAPQNPSMHWGWAGGYRFVCLEGKTSNNGGTTFPDIFQVHTVDTINYLAVNIPVQVVAIGDSVVVNIDADYQKIINSLDVTGGLTSHNSIGPSTTIVENMRDYVFSATPLSGIVEPGVVGSFGISPNPTSGNATLRCDLPGYEHLVLMVCDLAGRTVLTKQLSGAVQSYPLEMEWQPGLYIARLFSGEKLLAIEKIVVK